MSLGLQSWPRQKTRTGFPWRRRSFSRRLIVAPLCSRSGNRHGAILTDAIAKDKEREAVPWKRAGTLGSGGGPHGDRFIHDLLEQAAILVLHVHVRARPHLGDSAYGHLRR